MADDIRIDDIRIKDMQSTASYMESDDYLPIDGLALGNRKISFTGLMDSEDDRLPTTDKTPRGAITEHEGDISEIKQSLSQLDVDLTMSDNSTSHLNKFGRVITIEYYNNTNTTKAGVTGQLPSGAFDGRIRQLKFANTSIYINELGAFAIDANGWARLTATFVLNS